MNIKKTWQSGFTLIELMVYQALVAFILIILIGLITIAYQWYSVFFKPLGTNQEIKKVFLILQSDIDEANQLINPNSPNINSDRLMITTESSESITYFVETGVLYRQSGQNTSALTTNLTSINSLNFKFIDMESTYSANLHINLEVSHPGLESNQYYQTTFGLF